LLFFSATKDQPMKDVLSI